MRPVPNTPVVHLELHTGDISGARDFYDALCDWRSEQIEGGGKSYLSLELGGGLGGGIVQCQASRPIWLPYVEVNDIDSATDGARCTGAAVLLEPREGPMGWRSVVSSPAGGEIAFWQPKHSSEHKR
jgi:predicted enzyme related to lactoylglutathione lyase